MSDLPREIERGKNMIVRLMGQFVANRAPGRNEQKMLAAAKEFNELALKVLMKEIDNATRQRLTGVRDE